MVVVVPIMVVAMVVVVVWRRGEGNVNTASLGRRSFQKTSARAEGFQDSAATPPRSSLRSSHIPPPLTDEAGMTQGSR